MLRKLSLVLVMLTTGCVVDRSPSMNDPQYAPKYPTIKTPTPNTSGSLFAENGYISLFGDVVARRVGDIIIVRLNERTVSKKSASTTIKKETESTIAEPIVLGLLIQGPGTNGGRLNAIDSENDFSGSGGSDQSNSLQGTIAVTISAVLPNGTLLVRGEKWMRLNQGDEFIRITGMIRAVDIDSDNSIDSSKIANARITYGGKGVVADSNRMGWLARFFVNPNFAF